MRILPRRPQSVMGFVLRYPDKIWTPASLSCTPGKGPEPRTGSGRTARLPSRLSGNKDIHRSAGMLRRRSIELGTAALPGSLSPIARSYQPIRATPWPACTPRRTLSILASSNQGSARDRVLVCFNVSAKQNRVVSYHALLVYWYSAEGY